MNGRYYVGKHSTQDLDDNYLGSCKKLHEDMERFGYSNFEREVLYTGSTAEDALEYEAKIVNPEFIENPKTYNKTVGGFGGWNRKSYENYNKRNQENSFDRSIFNPRLGNKNTWEW